MRLNVTSNERDDIVLALRSWVDLLEEPVANPRSALAKRRRTKARQIDDLASRIYMAEVIPMPNVDESQGITPVSAG